MISVSDLSMRSSRVSEAEGHQAESLGLVPCHFGQLTNQVVPLVCVLNRSGRKHELGIPLANLGKRPQLLLHPGRQFPPAGSIVLS